MTKLFQSMAEPSPTFDRILDLLRAWLKDHEDSLAELLASENDWLLVNRDLNGRVRLILPESIKTSEVRRSWDQLASNLMERLGKHAYPAEHASMLFEASKDLALQGASSYSIEGFPRVWVLDRLATEANWTRIASETEGATRIVFFSIKGGVGRTTALAATAWKLAQDGKRVLVLDLDLESPGLSAALLPSDRQPMFGITDWLVEDLVDNGDAVIDNMVSNSDLSHDGDIYVVPAHGAEHGEYIAKLGRVWMPKLRGDGTRETWSARLARLLDTLEDRLKPDVVLIDSRSGIDEIASACITDMRANLILLFALEGEQTWNGYRMLLEQWLRADVAKDIRERLQVVAAMVPETERVGYLQGLRESAYGVFIGALYDEIKSADPGAIGPDETAEHKWRVGELVEGWNFDESDVGAPHYPWEVNWNRGFAGLRSLHGRLAEIDAQTVQTFFGPLIEGVSNTINTRTPS